MTSGSTQPNGGLVPEGVETEPMLLLDVTGSMSYPAAEGGNVSRRDVIKEAIGTIVERLAAEDSQAAHEEGGGGLMTVIFANGEAESIDDLNPDNLNQKWAQIPWGGGTRIMPGWRELVNVYNEEFGSRPANQRPQLLALVITDGEADDTDQFARTVQQAAGGVYICIALLGYGHEHDRAEAAYRQIEENNAHVKVVSFAGETDPNTIADGLLRMIA
jgi:hypothetical protein